MGVVLILCSPVIVCGYLRYDCLSVSALCTLLWYAGHHYLAYCPYQAMHATITQACTQLAYEGRLPKCRFLCCTYVLVSLMVEHHHTVWKWWSQLGTVPTMWWYLYPVGSDNLLGTDKSQIGWYVTQYTCTVCRLKYPSVSCFCTLHQWCNALHSK